MKFIPERLIFLRESLGLNKAEAARKLNMSAMGYGRYEKGEREPSFQTVSFIAKEFGTTADYLYGLTDQIRPDSITISALENPELFSLVQICQKDHNLVGRLTAYLEKMNQ